MSEGISYKEILDNKDAHHGFGKKHRPKKKALEKAKKMEEDAQALEDDRMSALAKLKVA
jgi:hypothetical protein